MDIIRKTQSRLRTIRNERNLQRIYHKCREFTMIPERTFLDNLRIAEQVRSVSGCIVECGVWRGGMTAGLSYLLGNNRAYYLFDSFEGLPPAKPIDGISAIRWQQDKSSPTYYDNCRASYDDADKVMHETGSRNYHLVRGWFDKTLPGYIFPDPIALLRLDADWYDSTMICLNSLFDHVAEKGIIIIDDYFSWDGCSRALHDFLSRRSAIERIRSNCGVCYIIKMAHSSQES